MSFLRFLSGNAPWLAAGGLFTLASSFGQTYFIAVFSGAFRDEFGLSHGEWGGLYMTATLASAALLTQTGALSDRFSVRALALAVLTLFALVAVGVSFASSVWMLGLLIFGLRFCGQGMMSHISAVAMTKWFALNRGKALATAGLGYTIGESFAPAGALAIAAWIGWRGSWLAAAAALVLVGIPLTLILLRRERARRGGGEADMSPGRLGGHWRRGAMLRHWFWWALLPGALAPGWIGTVLFFQAVPLVEAKGWDLLVWTGWGYPAYSVAALGSLFLFGALADRAGALRLLPLFLLPYAAGIAVIAGAGAVTAGLLGLVLFGIGNGAVHAVWGVLWPEVYGVRHLGAIRALYAAVMVLSSALGPGVSGALLDLGIGVEAQCFGMGAYLLAASLWFLPVSRRLAAEGAARRLPAAASPP